MSDVATRICGKCGLRVVDGSTDWGGVMLDPGCDGIMVKVKSRPDSAGVWEAVAVVTRDELEAFLERAYGKKEERF